MIDWAFMIFMPLMMEFILVFKGCAQRLRTSWFLSVNWTWETLGIAIASLFYPLVVLLREGMNGYSFT